MRRAFEIVITAIGMGMLHRFGGWQLLGGVALVVFPLAAAVDRKANRE